MQRLLRELQIQDQTDNTIALATQVAQESINTTSNNVQIIKRQVKVIKDQTTGINNMITITNDAVVAEFAENLSRNVTTIEFDNIKKVIQRRWPLVTH